MARIALVACVLTKKNKPLPAEELYDSPLFKKTMEYAKTKTDADSIYILSAKHKLLPIKKVIEPYNMTLNNFSADEKKKWAEDVLAQLKSRKHDPEKDTFIFLAGNSYTKYLEEFLPNHEKPLKGKRIGQQMKWLNSQLKEIVNKIRKSIKSIIYELYR